MSGKIGDQAYNPMSMAMRGMHEIGNALYPESNIPLRDHSGLYGSREAEQAMPEPQLEEPELEHDEPEIDR